MEPIYNKIIQTSLIDIAMIGSPAIVMFGYILYLCACSNKPADANSNDVTERESQSPCISNDIHDKNSKLAFMLMMLLSVEPKLSEKYIHFARNIGYDHIVEDIAQDREPESE